MVQIKNTHKLTHKHKHLEKDNSQKFWKLNHPQVKKVASLIEKLLLHLLYKKQIILAA